MKIEDCLTCKNHIAYKNGYVMCDYHKVPEQRMTQIMDNGSVCVINCPKKEDGGRR